MRLLLLGQQLKSLPIDFFENFLLVRKFIFQPEHRFFLALQRALGFCPLPPQLLEGLPNLSDFDFRLLHLFFKLLLDGTFLRIEERTSSMRLCVSALRASIAVLSAAAPRETAFEEFPALRITVFSAVFLGVFLETCFCAVRVFAACFPADTDRLCGSGAAETDWKVKAAKARRIAVAADKRILISKFYLPALP